LLAPNPKGRRYRLGPVTLSETREGHRRCSRCGSTGVCPDNAVIKLADGQYEIDYDCCKCSGICVTECPCGFIEMVPEET
jgi:Pyruvate/2-oxoacid:ferredoxin oxidoreductase delta subunit